jgi:hypothetical protein
MIHKLSDEQIHEIAETIDAADEVCYVNRDTGEFILMMNNERLCDYEIYWEDDEEDAPDDTWPAWQKEMHNDVKADMDKIYSWGLINVIRVKKPESHESFEFMERFVDEIIPEGKLKQDFWKALSRTHPFRNFNAIVHNCKYREDWFRFKQMAMEEYVRREIGQDVGD